MLVPTIGIEVHAELKSKSKVYSHSLNSFNSEPNTNVNVIDLGYPGTLPILNKEVIKMALEAALAFHCHINQFMHFDRKNYFYPDLPKGYQITQQDTPIGYDGYLEIEINGTKKKIGIERIHIEEDTCKSIHSENGTLLNFNRAGVPLIEIVSKPDMETPEEAMAYLEKLRETLLYLGISDVKIEEGSMRCDTNVSLKEQDSSVFGTKVEVKNIGSIRNVGLAIEYEMKRQAELINQGIVIHEETRRFNDSNNTTILMRTKETGNDYRYFPEPDIPPILLSDEYIEEVKANLPILGDEIRDQFITLGLNEKVIKTLLGNKDLADFFCSMKIMKEGSKLAIKAANLLTGDVLSYLNKEKIIIADIKLKEDNLTELVTAIEEGTISSKQGKEILEHLIQDGGTVKDLIEQLGMKQNNNVEDLKQLVKTVIEAHPDSVADFKAGKDRAIKFLMGQIMKETKGSANPVIVNQLLNEMIRL